MNETFKQLSELDVNEFTEKKNGLTYLSWANAWKEFCKVVPNATYLIKKDEQGKAHFGDSTNGYMVYTEVTVDEITHEMWLPVMDFRNKAILTPTTVDVNKAIMRCLTKNLAMFGLGLYIYAGEDLPESSQEKVVKQPVADPVLDRPPSAPTEGEAKTMIKEGNNKSKQKNGLKLLLKVIKICGYDKDIDMLPISDATPEDVSESLKYLNTQLGGLSTGEKEIFGATVMDLSSRVEDGKEIRGTKKVSSLGESALLTAILKADKRIKEIEREATT